MSYSLCFKGCSADEGCIYCDMLEILYQATWRRSVYTFRVEFKIDIFLQSTENREADHRVSHPRIPVLQGSNSFMCSHKHKICVGVPQFVCVCVCVEIGGGGGGGNFGCWYMYFGFLPKSVQYKRSPDASNAY
jgi:hypothetical protein